MGDSDFSLSGTKHSEPATHARHPTKPHSKAPCTGDDGTSKRRLSQDAVSIASSSTTDTTPVYSRYFHHSPIASRPVSRVADESPNLVRNEDVIDLTCSSPSQLIFQQPPTPLYKPNPRIVAAELPSDYHPEYPKFQRGALRSRPPRNPFPAEHRQSSYFKFQNPTKRALYPYPQPLLVSPAPVMRPRPLSKAVTIKYPTSEEILDQDHQALSAQDAAGNFYPSPYSAVSPMITQYRFTMSK